MSRLPSSRVKSLALISSLALVYTGHFEHTLGGTRAKAPMKDAVGGGSTPWAGRAAGLPVREQGQSRGLQEKLHSPRLTMEWVDAGIKATSPPFLDEMGGHVPGPSSSVCSSLEGAWEIQEAFM